MERLSVDRLEREIGLRGSLHEFVKMAWPLVEPGTPFKDNWHVRLVCDHLEAVSRGEIRKLIINVPPGSSKSLLTSVFWPAWEWVRKPRTRWINVSFDGGLTLRDARRMLLILRSDWYRERWGDRITMPLDVAAGEFGNVQGGWRFSTSVEGKMTGRHCDIMIIDDPIKPQDISKTTLEACKRWWTETVPSRFGDQKTGRRVMIMQRLHEEDLAGVAIREGGWEHLRIPMRFEAQARSATAIGGDTRQVDGELMDPERFPEEAVHAMEIAMGTRTAAAQLQQRPAPAAGAIFMRKWFKKYAVLPARFDQQLISVDAAFKDTDGSDYVCGTVWGMRAGEFYLLDRVKEHLDFPGTCELVERLVRKFPKAMAKLIEDKANGSAVIQVLQKKIPGIVAIEPEGGKEARAHAVAPLYEAGNVWHPDASLAPWVDDFEEEMVVFPFGSHDDQVDSTTQALLYMHGRSAAYAQAMAKVRAQGGLW